MKIPITKLLFDRNEEKAITETLRTGWVMQGIKVRKFESLISNYTKSRYAKATSSGTAALHLSLLACGIKPEDEVIVPSFTCVATVNPIEYIGAKPVFVDVELKTFNIDTAKIEKAITKKTKAIIPVHMFGLCVNMSQILNLQKKYNFKIIEDAALALGSFYKRRHAGTFGDVGCISFHPRKTITTGEGGMIITNNKKIAYDIEVMRNYGASISTLERHQKDLFVPPQYNILGYNYKMTDLHASIGCEQIKKLRFVLKRKKELAQIYNQELKSLAWLKLPYVSKNHVHSYQSYVCLFTPQRSLKKKIDIVELEVMYKKRNELMKWLNGRGIATVFGASAIPSVAYYKNKYNLVEKAFLNSLIASKLSIAIPLYPQMQRAEQDYVIDSLKYFGKTKI